MTQPGGRIEIRVDPDTKGFSRKLSGDLDAAAQASLGRFRATSKKELTAAAVEAAEQGRAAGEGFAEGIATRGGAGVDQLTRDAQGKLRNARGQFATEAEKLAAGMGDGFERGGDESGGLLAQGVRSGVIRNSPLIVAAITGALAVGGPAMLAGATGLFAGVGIVAAAQSERVQSTWLGTWQRIKAGAIADAAVIEPTLVKVADNVGDSFDRMRPRLRNAFADAAPQIEVFADGVLGLAENALPGLERAVERGMPVTQGLAAFLEKTGTGLTGFFDNISDKAPEAGQALGSLGDIVGELFPLLGTTLGQGAELAAVALPLLANGLGLVNTVAQALGPALPPLVAGFLALKAAQAASGWVGTLTDKFNALDTGSGRIRGGLDRVASVMTPVNVATGALAIGVGIVTAAMQASDDQVREWSDALRQGGAAARIAGDEMAAQEAKIRDLSTGVKGATVEFSGMSGILGIFKNDAQEARQATDDWWKSLDPVAQAQSKVAEWTATLSDRLQDESATTGEVEAAKRRLAYWQSEAARLADEEARAIRGVTEAMVEQANQARARVDAGFAFEQSLNGIEDAQKAYNDAVAEFGPASEEAQRAALELNMAYDESVAAAGRVAQSNLPASMDDTQRAILGAKGELDRLNELIAQGVVLPPSMEAYRQQLIAITGQADGAMLAQAQLAAAVGELGFAVNAVPGEKQITITAPTDELRAKLADLGFTIVELPNGDIEVTAETEEAKGNLGNLSALLTGLTNTTATPTVAPNIDPARAAIAEALGGLLRLGGQVSEPTISANDAPYSGIAGSVNANLTALGQRFVNPRAGLIDQASGGISNILGLLNSLRDKTVTVRTNYVSNAATTQAAARQLGLAGGGLLRGPGTGTSDSIALWGSNGEFMHRAAVVSRVGVPGMEAINRGDWAAAAARFTQLAEQQSRSAIAATRAARQAGHYAAGGYVSQNSRADAGGSPAPVRMVAEVRNFFDGRELIGLVDSRVVLREEVNGVEGRSWQ